MSSPASKSYAPSFIVTQESWYAHPALVQGLYDIPEIMIHLEDVSGEVALRWQSAGPRLEVFADSWDLLHQLPALTTLLVGFSRQGVSPTVETMKTSLEQVGFKNATQAKPPKKDRALFEARVAAYEQAQSGQRPSQPTPHPSSRARPGR